MGVVREQPPPVRGGSVEVECFRRVRDPTAAPGPSGEPRWGMLRLMNVRRHLAALVVVLALAACGTEAAGQRSSADSRERRLLAAADAAGKNNGGEAKRVEVVRTIRGGASDLTGHSNQAQDEAVWVVQVSGDDYSCGSCPRPAGAPAPTGRFLTLVLRASDYKSTDFGMLPNRTDLARLGQVELLRDER